MTSLPNNISSRSHTDRILLWLLRLAAAVAGTILLFIIVFLFIETGPVLQHIGVLPFFLDDAWHPTEGLYNLTPMVIGSLLVTAGAVLIATPLGILSAIFCRFYAPLALSRWYRHSVQLLAGIPSVVYGFWGLVVVVPLIGHYQPPGPSLLAGIVILTLMILPTIMLLADASLANVPKAFLKSAAALGLGRWSMVRQVVLPAARSGLLTGILLGTGRAIGETMAVLMVCGNVVRTPSSVFDPVRTLTSNIALEMAYAIGNHRSALFMSGVLLIMAVLILVLGAEEYRRRHHYAL